MVSTAAFDARVRVSVPGLGGLKETKMFLPHPRVKLIIVGSLRERASVLNLRPPGLEFRIPCLEDSVISFISPSSGGSPGPVCAQRWPKARFILFHFPTLLNGHSRCIDIDISSFLTYGSVSQSGGECKVSSN